MVWLVNKNISFIFYIVLMKLVKIAKCSIQLSNNLSSLSKILETPMAANFLHFSIFYIFHDSLRNENDFVLPDELSVHGKKQVGCDLVGFIVFLCDF